MIKEAIEYIVRLGNTRIEEVFGQQFSTQPLHLVAEARVKALTLNSLSGVVAYLKSNFDSADQRLIHIVSPTEVVAFSHFNRDMERNIFIKAQALIPQFHFDKFYDVEEFNIALQSRFVGTTDRDHILKIVGNIKDENVTTFGDDGVSQQVTAKVGIATVDKVKVPNPVNLRPFRTFVEVEQPESAFVFRMRSGQAAPACALFEADGGAWKNEAMTNVLEYLNRELAELIENKQIVIIA